ncbi:AraC family transcriptional regulator [Alteribacillus sp. YIM 98480]|uniref:AraC family transcriptional regulator n=1 Tax=Alteribacillus sp. YIM 98480 TaxID=2606599 RepID=UPI00131CEC13|nr:AraC family transcriptional regulator [Alteribacillus sp. YIM 98480]
MFPKIKGVLQPSEMYIHTESEFAKKALYYTTFSGEFYCDQNYHVERDTYHSYLLLFIKQGKMKVKYNNREFLAKQNDLLFLDCHNHHVYSAKEYVHFEYFHFDGSSAENYFDLLYRKNGCIFPMTSSLIPKYIHHIVKMNKSNSIDEHFVSMTIHKILYELVHVTNQSVNELEHQIQRAITHIENFFKEEISLEQLAKQSNLSVYYFVRMFKVITGSSPYQYILDYRIQYAKNQLKSSDNSIENIAFDSGFNSLSHFITTFKKRTHITPNKFRKMQF